MALAWSCGISALAQDTATVSLHAALDTVHFEADTLKGLFIWVAKAIRYAKPEKQDSLHPGTERDLIHEALANRSGVCEHFATLYVHAARAMGYEAYTVQGYTTADPDVGHVWALVRTKDGWREFDPTWGAGYFTGHIYHPHIDFRWYDVVGDTMRKTHIPVVPFLQQRKGARGTLDSLVARYFAMDTLHRAEWELEYVRQMQPNQLTLRYERYLRRLIAIHGWRMGVEELAKAVDAYNAYVGRRLHFFRKPRWDDRVIEEKSLGIVQLAKAARDTLARVDTMVLDDTGPFQGHMAQAEDLLRRAIHERSLAVKYLDTWPPFRNSVLLRGRD